MPAQILLPSIMFAGLGAADEIATVLTRLDTCKPLIVTDDMMVQLGYVQRLQARLDGAGIVSAVFADTVPEPTVMSISAGVKALQLGNYDCLIAIGGGSAIDSAKAIAVLAKFGGHMGDYKVPRIVHEQGLPVIAIPTTAGTGSEVTRFTVITDEHSGEKMLCSGAGFVPAAALLDYGLTLSLPPRITADTGIDALTHAIEAYVSRKASVFSDSQALAALRLLAPNLRTVYRDGANHAAREAMMLGANLAGTAFSTASVGLVHGMARPLGAFYHVPHGLSNAMLLSTVTAYSIHAAPERYAQCAVAMQIASKTDTTAEANRKLLDELHALNCDLDVPTPAAFGINRERFMQDIALMTEQALASGSPANNPKVPVADDIMGLYKSIWV